MGLSVKFMVDIVSSPPTQKEVIVFSSFRVIEFHFKIKNVDVAVVPGSLDRSC